MLTETFISFSEKREVFRKLSEKNKIGRIELPWNKIVKRYLRSSSIFKVILNVNRHVNFGISSNMLQSLFDFNNLSGVLTVIMTIVTMQVTIVLRVLITNAIAVDIMQIIHHQARKKKALEDAKRQEENERRDKEMEKQRQVEVTHQVFKIFFRIRSVFRRF